MKQHILCFTILIIEILLNAVIASGAERDAVVRIESGGKCSGVCVSPDGYILTAEHCVSNMKNGAWVLFGEKRFKATVVFDPERNLTDQAVLLKIESPYPLPYAHVSDTYPKKRDRVHAIGYPGGKYAEASGEVVSVSSLLRSRLVRSPTQTGYRIMVNFNSAGGNSGGPLFNERGEVVGLSATMSHEGAGWIGLQSIKNAMKRIASQRRVLYAFLRPGDT